MGTTWGQLGNELIILAREKRVPLVGQFELTPRCNLQCKMCYIGRRANDQNALKHELSTKDWISLAEEARDAGMLHLLLTGGEVFLRDDFKDMYEEISRMGFVTQIYTNATLITPGIAKWLGRIPPSKVGVTFYGASKVTYTNVCNNADGFEQAVNGIDLLLNEGITLELKTTVIQSNVNDFDQLAIFSEERGLSFRIVNYVSPRRDESNTCPEAERLSVEDLIDYEMYVGEYFKKKRNSKTNSNSTHDNCAKDNTPNDKNDHKTLALDTHDPFSCTSGKCMFWITWDGRMTPCGLMDKPATFPLKKGFEIAWKDLQNKCAFIPVAKECRKCSFNNYCMACPARLKKETGFYDRPAPYLCHAAKQRKLLQT